MKIINNKNEVLIFILIVITMFFYLDPRKNDVTDPQFDEYKSRFETTFNRDAKSVPITFGDNGKNILGVCFYYHRFNQREIQINQKYWENSSDIEHEMLITHELGHCVLNEDHRNFSIIMDEERIPGSLMNEYLINPYFYIKYKDYYIKEMKQNESKQDD